MTKMDSSRIFISIALIMAIVLSSLSLFSHNGLSQSGSWTDLFDDESKIAQKDNVIVSGGDVSLGPSGMKWFRQGMVLDVGPIPSTYESSGWPTVVKGSDGVFRMWYTGREAASPVDNLYIRYATSADGKTWNRMGVVIGPNVTLEDRVYAPTVIEDGGIFKMWYVGDDRDPPWGSYIFYATSPDGYTWTRQGLVLPKDFEGTYDNDGSSFPSVIKDGGVYKMWYSGYDGTYYRILYATSPDGQSWTYQNLAIDKGSNPSDYDYAWAFKPTILKDASGLYHIWYTGSNWSHFRILNATSPDGETWTKQGLSLDILPDSNEDLGVVTGSVVISPGSVVTIWYQGSNTSYRARIFRATLGRSGHIVSEAIGPHPGCDWGDFFANKTDQNQDIFVSFSVLDAVDWTIIPGYWNLTDTQFSLLSIDPLLHPTIRMRADFWNLQGNFTLIPELHDWTVTWIDPNSLPDIVVSSDEIFFAFFPPLRAGQPVGLMINTTNAGDVLAENFTLVIFVDFDDNQIPGFGENISVQHIASIGPFSYNISGAEWIPMTAGVYTICAFADSFYNVTESNETNNVGCRDVEVLPGGVLTTLVVGQPNHVSDQTFITSATPLTLQVEDLAGMGVAYTEYRVDCGNWLSYVTPFYLLDEGFHLLEYRSANPYGFLESVKQDILAVDNTPPSSEMAVGEPLYIAEDTWIRSSTPLTITSDEPALNTSVLEEIRGIEVYLEPIDDGEETFFEYLARVNQTISREIWPGLESVTFHVWGPCPDIDIGVFYDANRDGERQVSEFVDYDADADSDEMVTIESPDPGPYILAIAGFSVQPGGCLVDVDIVQEFGGNASSDLADTRYRVWSGSQWSDWSDYTASFSILDEGLAYVSFFAMDNLGNAEPTHNRTLIVDDTPPRSTGLATSRTDGGYDILITFQDDGCGVDVSHYRFVGDDQWESSILLEVSLNKTSPGNYTVEFYSIDYLGNVENVKSLTVVIKAAPPPPTDNWKPLVAAIFALVLALVGLWVSRRRPWKGRKDARAVLITFSLLSLPFVIAEVLTGIFSSLTGLLSIPPAFGVGTLVDLAILVSGILVALYYSRRPGSTQR